MAHFSSTISRAIHPVSWLLVLLLGAGQVQAQTPSLTIPAPSSAIAEGTEFTHVVPSDAFTGGVAPLTYAATLADGTALPRLTASTGFWLRFGCDPLTDLWTFRGTPDDIDVGTHVITVTATDSTSPTPVSVQATLTVSVTNINEKPVLVTASQGYPNRTFAAGSDVSMAGGLPSASDIIIAADVGDTLGYSLTVTDTDGDAVTWLTVNATSGNFSGTTTATGSPFAVTLRATASPGDPADYLEESFTITVTAGNVAPLARPDALAITEDASAVTATIDGRGNIFSNDDGLRGFMSEAPSLVGYIAGSTYPSDNTGTTSAGNNLTGTLGTLNIAADGTFSYETGSGADDLKSGQVATEQFTYRVTDGQAGSVPSDGLVTVTVTGVNDAPTVSLDATAANHDLAVTESGVNGSMAVAGDADAAGTLALSDPDDSSHTWQVKTAAESASGYVTGTAAANSANPAQTGTDKNGTYGTLYLAADGTFTYELDQERAVTQQLQAAASGIVDSFQIRAGDGTVNSAPATVSIAVTGTNDAPALAVAELRDQSVIVGEMASFTVAGAFADVDSATLTYSATYLAEGGSETAVPSPGSGSFWLKLNQNTGAFSGTAAAGGPYTITVTASDSVSPPATAQASFTLTPAPSTAPYTVSLFRKNLAIESRSEGTHHTHAVVLDFYVNHAAGQSSGNVEVRVRVGPENNPLVKSGLWTATFTSQEQPEPGRLLRPPSAFRSMAFPYADLCRPNLAVKPFGSTGKACSARNANIMHDLTFEFVPVNNNFTVGFALAPSAPPLAGLSENERVKMHPIPFTLPENEKTFKLKSPSDIAGQPGSGVYEGLYGPGANENGRVAQKYPIVTNVYPIDVAPLSDQVVPVGEPYTYQFPEGTFYDANGDSLIYTAGVGVSPGVAASLDTTWLSFDAATRTFTGMPTALGVLNVRLAAYEGCGFEDCTAVDAFDITVAPQITIPDPATVVRVPWTGGPVSFTRSMADSSELRAYARLTSDDPNVPIGDLVMDEIVPITFLADETAGTATVTVNQAFRRTGAKAIITVLAPDDPALASLAAPGVYLPGVGDAVISRGLTLVGPPAANTKPTAVADSFGISSTHTRTVTLSGNVITGVAGTGLTTEGGATDIMLGADMDDGGVSNLRVTFVSAALSDGSLDPDGAQTPGSTGTTVTLTSGQGSLTINETGAFTYTPPTGDFEFFFGVSPNRAKRAIAAGETGTISVAYRIADMASPALDDDGVLTITVTAPTPNTAPTLVSNPTVEAAVQGMAYSMDLARFFTDGEGDDLTFKITTGTCAGFTIGGMDNGFLVGVGTSPEGSVTATANTDCTVTANDGTVDSAPASFTIAVTVPPTTVSLGTPLPTEYDADGTAALTFPLVRTGDSSAELNVSINVSITDPGGNARGNTYTRSARILANMNEVTASIPHGGANRLGLAMSGDTITLKLTAAPGVGYTLGDPSTFTVSVTGTPPNRAPVAVADPIPIGEGAEDLVVTARDMGVLANDTDDGDATMLAVVNFEQALNATATYDGTSPTTAGSAANINFLGTTSDPGLTNGEKVADFTLKVNGTYTLSLVDSAFDYLGAGDTELFYVRYQIRDDGTPALNNSGSDGLITITVNGANDAPTAVPVTGLTVAENKTLRLAEANFGFRDVDRGDELASITITALPSSTHGVLMTGSTPTAVNAVIDDDAIGTMVFDPAASSATNTAMISYTVNDGMADSPAAVMSIAITAAVTNQAPVARDDLVAITTADLLSLDPTSFDSDGYLYVVTTGNRTGQRPDPLPAGADTDPDGDDTALRVTRVAAGETLGSSPTDIPGTGSVEISGDNGAVFVSALGGFTYTPTASVLKALSPGGTLEDKFTYEISDGTDVATALYTIRITKPAAANSKPVLARGDSDKTSVTEAGGVANATAGDPSANGAFSSTDADNDTLTLQARASANSGWTTVSANATAIPGGVYGSLSVNTDGSWTYTLDNDCGSTPGDPGCATEALNVRPPPFESDDFSFRLDDGNTDNATRYSDVLGLQVSVTGANDAPVAPSPGTPDATAVEGGSFSHTALAFTDVDNDDAKLMYTATYESGGSQVALPAWLEFDGATRQFSSTSAVTGAYDITVTASDGGLTATDEFTLTVSALPTVSISALPEVTAGDALTFTLSRTGGTAADLTVAYNIGLSTGTGGGDFTATFLATNNTVEVTPTLTTTASQEITVKVLTTAEAATASQTVGRYNVDDTAKTRMITVSALPVVSVSGFDPTRLDAGDSLGFELSRSGGTTAALTVAYNLTLSTGTGAGAATAVIPIGANSVDVTPTLTTVAGQTITVTVLASGDSLASSLSGVGMYALGTGDNLTRSITVNSPPTAVDDMVAGTEKAGSITGDVINGSGSPLSGTDMDVDGISTLSVTRFALGDMASDLPGTNNAGMAVTGDHGSLTINANGSFTYAIDDDNNVLQVGEMNTDGFIYEISDSTLMATGTLTITINGVNNGPILVGRIGNQSAVVNEMVKFSVGDDVFNDVDNDDSTLTYRITEKGLCTWLGITSTTGVFTGTPTEVPASNGRCEITVEVSDGAGGTSTDNFSLIVTAVANVAPVAAADTNTVGENTASVSGNVITGHPTTMAGQDTDANAGQTPGVRDYAPGTDITMGNVGGVARVATGRYGTLTIAADGAYTYAVNAAANDSLVSATDTNEDVFTYEIGDGIARGVTATLTITITGVNDAPKAVSPAPTVKRGIIGAAYSLPLAQFFTDPDHATLAYGLSGTCDGFALNSAGTDLVGSESGNIPAATTAGDKTCMITATDNVVATPVSTSITIAVSTTAPPPVISITGWPRDSEVDAGSDATFTVTRTGSHASELFWDFAIDLTNAGASMPKATNSVTLRNDPPAFAIGSATATGTIAAGTLSVNGDGGAGQIITVRLLAPDHLHGGNLASKLVDGSYTVPDSGDGLTRSYTYVTPPLPGPQPVADQPPPDTATYGTAYSLSLPNFFTNPDDAQLIFTIGTGTCAGFKLDQGGTQLVGTGTSPENSVTATVDTNCTITASDGTNPASMVSFTIPVTVPAGATNTPPTLTKTDTKVAVTEAGVDASNAAVAGDPAANGSLMATDMEQTALGIQGCADTVASTACTGFRDGTTAGLGIPGIYGTFTLTAPANSNSFTWTYMLDNTDSDTNALAAGGATATETLRVRADDGVGNTTDMAGMGRSRHSTTLAVEVTITGTNDRPTVANAIPSVMDATQGERFNYTVPQNTFTDVDDDDAGLTITVTQDDTDATNPPSLSYDTTTRQISGSVPANGTGRVAVSVNAGDGKGGMATAMFTLNLLAVPVPVDQTTAETDSIELTPDVFGFQDDDTRLESVTITSLPDPDNEGRLLLNGNPVMANTPIMAAALANLEFVPVNRKVSAAGTATATYMLTYTTAGTNGGASSGTVNIVITFSDSVPTVAAGIDNQEIAEDTRFTFPIPLDAFDPVDIDDPITLAETPTQANGSPLPSWLMFMAGSGLGTFSGTPPEKAPDVTVRVTVKDVADNKAFTDFIFQVTGGRPTFTIFSVTHDSASGEAVVTVGLLEGSSNVTGTVTVTVNVTADNGYIANEKGKEKTATFTAANANQVVRVKLDRRLGPDAMITAEVLPSTANDYEVSPPTAGSGQARIAAEDESRNVRGQYVEHALGGFARSMGWGVVDSVRNRMSVVGAGGAMQRSAVDLSGLVDYAQARAGSDVDVKGLLALARAAGEGDSEQSAAELSGLVKDYLQSRASPEGGPVAYHEAALAVREAGEGGSSELTAAELSGLVRDYLQSGAGPESGPARAVSGAADSVWDGVLVWSSLKRDDLSFDDKGLDFKGDTTSLALGIEKALGSKGLLGVAVNWHDGKLDLADDNYALAVSGEVKMEQWSLAPYAVLATDHGRIWGSVGIGGGTLDYKDRHGVFTETGSSDVSMNVLAAGAEYDIMETHSWELLGRVEGMSASMETGDEDDGLYGNQDVRVHGIRGEFEFAWPTVSASGDHYRPYLTAGYRLDEGDGTGGKAFEYGGGLDVDTGDFTFSGSARLQGLEGEGDYDRRSYTYAMAYDRGRDRRGLSLSMQNSYGSAESRDYFARQVPWARSANGGLSADERSRTDMEAGYGFAVRGLLTGHSEGMLKPFVKTNLDGSAASEWSLGLTLESGFGNIGLEHKTRPATGRREDDQHEIQLKFNFDF